MSAPPTPVLAAAGIEKAHRRGLWPLARGRVVLSGAELTLCRGEVDVTNYRAMNRMAGSPGPTPRGGLITVEIRIMTPLHVRTTRHGEAYR
jgi:hypothetical protein